MMETATKHNVVVKIFLRSCAMCFKIYAGVKDVHRTNRSADKQRGFNVKLSPASHCCRNKRIATLFIVLQRMDNKRIIVEIFGRHLHIRTILGEVLCD